MTRRVFLLAVAAVLAFSVTASADWDPTQPYKWVQYPDLNDTGMDVNACDPFYLLADDFLCTTTGPLTDIHIWGSWYHDVLPEGVPTSVAFTLSIHEDVPADTTAGDHSRPGDILWIMDFQPGSFSVQMWADGLTEGWYEPPDIYEPLGDTVCWPILSIRRPGSAGRRRSTTGTTTPFGDTDRSLTSSHGTNSRTRLATNTSPSRSTSRS